MERVEVKSDTVLVLYMSSSFWLLGVESLDFSFAEKEKTAFKVPIRVKVDQMIYFKLISNIILIIQESPDRFIKSISMKPNILPKTLFHRFSP